MCAAAVSAAAAALGKIAKPNESTQPKTKSNTNHTALHSRMYYYNKSKVEVEISRKIEVAHTRVYKFT